MCPSSLQRLAGALAVLLLLAAGAQGAPVPAASERGYPLIQTYEPSLPEASTEHFDATRDPRGVLYFANLTGVLVYDGAWWQRIEVGKAISAFRVESDAKGRVAVGGVDNIGYLSPDGHGTLRYVSLLDLLPPQQRDLGQVLTLQATAQGFAFMTSRRLLVWDGTRVATVATFPGDRPYAVSFSVGREVCVWTREGISRLRGTRLEPVPGGEAFRGRRVDEILPADGGMLVSVRGEGLFLLRDGQVTPFAPEASRWTAAKRLISGTRLADGRWALGSVLGGLLLLRPDGTVDQVIDSAAGLPDDFVAGMVADREGSLWLALNNGLARIEIASPLSVLDRRTGLQGQPYTVARHGGALWVGGSGGLFTTAGAASENSPPVRLRSVAGVPPGVWSLLSVGDGLLLGSASGVFEVRGTDARLIPGTEKASTTYALARSADPARVWLGREDGLAAIRRTGDGWRYEGKVEGLSSEVRSLVESRDGTVWCGTERDGLVGLRIPPGPGMKPASRRVVGSGDVNVALVAGRILVVKENQVLRLDEARGTLVREPDLPSGPGGDFSAVAEDAGGNLWLSSRPPAVALRRGTGWEARPRSLPGVPGRGVETLFTEPDGVIWLATDKGLIRYEGSPQAGSAALPPPLFARLTASDALLFGGAPGAAPRSVELPPYVRHLRIEFAPLSFRAGLRYQTRLEPLDARWSDPTTEPFAELTRLPPGEYAFHVRTLGPNGEAGPEAGWSFHVRQPWYQTWWAIALWVAAALLGVWGYAWLRGRALRQRAAHLEARVSEQTVALRNTVEELRRAHTDLGAANARLEELSLRDELTGIANRRRLQQALAEEWSHTRQSIAFLLLDLDYFKRLNDSHGHLAGDLCLQSVAAFVAETARPYGGLAARYGGEELAVLLPGLGLDRALQVAERLRAGIEALAIPNAGAPLGHLTASVGAAAMLPDADQTPEGLIETADLALYQAKAEGRNRACAGRESLAS